MTRYFDRGLHIVVDACLMLHRYEIVLKGMEGSAEHTLQIWDMQQGNRGELEVA